MLAWRLVDLSRIGIIRKVTIRRPIAAKSRFVVYGAVCLFGLLNPSLAQESPLISPVPFVANFTAPPSEGSQNGTPLAEALPYETPPLEDQVEVSGPYWLREQTMALKAPIERTAAVDIETIVWAALTHSPHIHAIQTRPLVQETEIQQSQGIFDPTRFGNSIWNDTSDPVGNTLTTGGPNRLNAQNLETKLGVRRKNELGGNLEAFQDLNLRDNNSVFFVPRKQADSRMVLRYTQPLMKGYGRTYNRATITIAELNFGVSSQQANQALQTHVMDLTEAFWDLVYQRSLVTQINNGIERMTEIHRQLSNRTDLDLIQNQLLRASSAISSLYAKRARALAQVVESEERLRQLVNAPWIQPAVCDEIVPKSLPLTVLLPIQVENELAAALMSRPDVLAIRDELKAANVKLRVAEQELRPTLNLVSDFYVRGLNGQYDAANSFADQFATGAPSYSGGFEYLRPKNLTTGHAIRRQRDLEIRQLLFELEDRLLIVGKEVRTAIASVQASHAELEASANATIATNSEVEYLESRWQNSTFLEPTQISLNLEQLLDAQQRLTQTEGNWAATQSQYMTSLARLRFVEGALLSTNPPQDE
ncbi:MAG: hypothetical protein SGI77_02610 [Pirellulaceae bacterium]|nr:hypothetical protein [Pirellulaceae bacterium]